MWEDALADQRLRHEWGSWRSRSRRRMREGAGEFILKIRIVGEDQGGGNYARGTLEDQGLSWAGDGEFRVCMSSKPKNHRVVLHM